MDNLPLVLSVLPFAIFIFFLIIKKTFLLKASFITLILYTLLALVYWKIYPNFLYISYGKGFFIAIDILIIIFGAIFFLKILEESKIIGNISFYLSNFSKDYRIQVIIIAWFFGSFLEGTAGFGIPAAITVPILIGLGLTPLRALIIGLLGNSAPGVFGAAGTPIGVGYAGLAVESVPYMASIINLVAFIVPVFMLWVLTQNRTNRKSEFLDALPFAIWSGVAFVLPSVLIAQYWAELPSILGSVIGLILVIITTKFNIFTPKLTLSLNDEIKNISTMTWFKSFLPYLILIILLIVGKILLTGIGVKILLGFKHTFNIFNPGFAFILAGLITMIVFKNKFILIKYSAIDAIKRSFGPFLVIVSMLALVQIMINSGNNNTGISSAIVIISKYFETSFLPFIAPFVGAFGGFITGSVTVSNIMFGNLFVSASNGLMIDSQLILSLGVVGGAAGNMIALADILTAEAVVGVKDQERIILKGVIIPCLIYLTLAGLVGYFLF